MGTCKNSIVDEARTLSNTYKAMEVNNIVNEPCSSMQRTNDIDDYLEEYLGLDSSERNDFDEYIKQGRKSIKDSQGATQLLAWWRTRGTFFQN